jgi:hypothetical protein
MPYGIKQQRREKETPQMLDVPHSALNREYGMALLHVSTIEKLEEFSRKTGESYDTIIKSALATYTKVRANEHYRKYSGKKPWSKRDDEILFCCCFQSRQ